MEPNTSCNVAFDRYRPRNSTIFYGKKGRFARLAHRAGGARAERMTMRHDARWTKRFHGKKGRLARLEMKAGVARAERMAMRHDAG